MVGIVSGASLGLELTSLRMLREQGQIGDPAQGRSGERVYVNVSTGNLVVQDIDDRLMARGSDLPALRTYNSRGVPNDDNGDGWTNGIALRPLVVSGTFNTAGSTIERTDRDGSVALYRWSVPNLYTTNDGEGAADTLSFVVGDNQFEWRDGSTGATQRYEATGNYRLLTSRDPSGNALTYAYNAAGNLASITTASGDVSLYDYVGTNLSQIRTVTAAGVTTTAVRYGYENNRLATVTVDLSPEDNSVADGKVYQTTYTYDAASGRLATLVQSDGTSLTFTYTGSAGNYRLASIRDALGGVTTLTYGAASGGVAPTTLTAADNVQTRFDIDAASLQLTKITTAGIQIAAFTYTANNDLASFQDGSSRITTYGYDASGNLTGITDAAATRTRTYDGRNQLLTETVSGGGTAGTTRYVYDAGGRNQLRFVVSAEGRVTEQRYDAFGQHVATIVYTSAQYPVAGLANSQALDESQMAAWASAQSPGATQRVDLHYDGRGQLDLRTSYAKVDAAGAGVMDGSQSVERFVYDQAGRLLQTIAPTGGVTTFTYDGLGRELSRTDAAARTTLTQYLDGARKTVVTLASGLVSTSLYDAAGRLVSVVDATAASATLGETKYFHDAAGRLRMTQDPTGVRRWMLYDGAGRKVAEIDGNGTLTESGYDGAGRPTFLTTYGTAVNTAPLVDAAGAPVLGVTLASIRPAAGSTDVSEWRSYDAAGRLFRVARATGTATAAVTENRCDAASRLIEVVQYANLLVLDGVAVVPGTIAAPAGSPADRSSRNFYDADGNLLATLDGEGYLVKNVYSAAGQLSERIAFTAATAPSLRATGTLAQLTPASSAGDARTVHLRDGEGRVIGEVDAEGYLTETVYDANGNATTTVRYANRTTGAVASTASLASIRPSPSASDRITTRTFDALDRLVREIDPGGVVTQYDYDAAGRLVSTTRAAGTSEARAVLARYDLQGRLVGELSAEGAALLTGGQTQAQVDAIWAQYGTTHAYDAAGRRVSSTDALGSRTLFFYNADGALTHAVNALGQVHETRYDVQGRVTDRIDYADRIATAGLAGGLVTAALTSAVAAIANAANDAKASISYTRDGLAATDVDAEGYATTSTYNSFGERISSSQALGSGASLTRTYSLDKRGLTVGMVSDAASVNAVTSTDFDAFGRVIRTIDANGNVREHTFDRLGREVVTTDPLNAARTTGYDAFGRVLSQTDALGRTTTFAYDKAARTMTVTTPEGIVTTTAYNRHGQVQSLSDGKGQVTTCTYDPNGRLLWTATPLTATATTYDTVGHAVQTTDANGTKVAYTYDAASRVLTRTVDPTGLNLVTSYVYDDKVRKVTVTDPNGVATTTTFDRKGQMVRQAVDPAGLNLQTTWSYDGAGRVLTVTSPAGQVTKTVYDALGRRIREHVDPDGLNLTRTWTYDKGGNALTCADALGQVTRFVYDSANRLVFVVDPLGNVRETTYDAENRVIKDVRYATAVAPSAMPATPTVSALQSLIVRQPALDVVEHRVYDRDGRMTWTIDATGGAVRYDRDANGNVVARIAFANRIDMATWVAGTTPQPVADPVHDAKTATVYDALDRAVYTVDGVGAVVATSYDGNGNVLQQTAYASAIPVATAATPAALSAAVALVADAARDASMRNIYDAANRLVWSVDGAGAVTQRIYDKVGNVVRQIGYATTIVAGTAPSSVAASAFDRTTSMAYDAANRLVFEVDALRDVTETAYDQAGRVVRRTAYATPIAAVPTFGLSGSAAAIRAALQVSVAGDRTSRFAYDAGGRRLFDVDPLGAVTQTRYDAAGRVIAVTRHATLIDGALLGAQPTLAAVQALLRPDVAADRTQLRAYDAAGRLAFEVDPLGFARAMQYDGTGRVVRTVRYAKDLAAGTPGTLAGIAAALVPLAGADRVETASYNAAGQLVATADALGKTESFTYDALGRKLSFTNKKGAVWTYASDAAGRLVTETSPQVALASVATNAAGDLVAGATVTAAVVTRLAYDALGQLVQRTEALGRPEQRTTRYEYDALGRQVRVVHPPVGVYAAAADNLAVNGAAGVAARTETTAALESRTFYDALGNAVASIDVGGALRQKAYDLNGNVAYEVDALGYVMGYQRNAFGEATSLIRYGAATILANAGVTQAAQAATRAQVEAALAAPGFSHTTDRTLLTTYDRAGRVLEAVEPIAYVYDTAAAPGQQAMPVGKTTRTAYNAFGEAVQIKLLRNPITDTWSTTTRYYDRAGQEVATVDALGYLTTRKYDAAGNLVKTREWATALGAGAWTVGSYGGLPATSEDDREVETDFDLLDHKTAERRLQVEYSDASNGASMRGTVETTYGYDAVGNQVRVTDALGNTTFTYYDALGRIEKVAAPARSSTVGGVQLTPLTEYRRDAYGNVVATIAYANGAASANQAAAVAAAPSTEDRAAFSRYDSFGHVVQATDANGSSEFSSWDAWGHLAKNWRGVTDMAGATRTSFQVSVYDKLGQVVETRTPASTSVLSPDGQSVTTVSQAQVGVISTAMEYNAFGEMTRRGTQAGRQEYFDYDTAGRLWRTNSGDGIDRIQLFDAQGNVTAELRSAGAGRDNIDLRAFANAQMADASPSTRRVDFSRDALGRIVRQQEAARLELQGGVSVQRSLVSAFGIVSALPGAGGSPIFDAEAFQWGSPNQVTLAWNSLAGLGAGDIKVTLEYLTPLVQTQEQLAEGFAPIVYTGGTARSYTSGVLDGGQAANGAALSWAETSPTSDGGVGRITRVIVYKKDVSGNWSTVIDQAPGWGRYAIDVAAPPDPGTAVTLEMRVAGTAGDVGWWSAGLVNYGSAFRFDAGGLAVGNYEYRVKVTPPAEVARTIGTGTVAITLPPLSTITTPISFKSSAGTGVLAWQTPGTATEQAFRYRPAGSTGAWSTLPIVPTLSYLFDSVDSTVLAAGTYQFELLWTPAGTGTPASHAVGQFTITPPQPAYWVPPVNLPPIQGLVVGTGVAGGTFGGYDENSQPIYSGGTTVPALQWTAADATVARYRLPGGAWTSLAIDNVLQFHDESLPVGVQKALLNGVPPGTYEVQILTGSPATMQATATLTVYPTSPGYYKTVTVQVPTQQLIIAYYAPVYETRYGTRQVAYQVWVNDPPVVVGYDEAGAPIYSYPGHYEARYYSETYAYQVQVGQTPVYARDEYGNLLYQTVYVTQQQQVWVPGTTPTPTIVITTPPYTPGYTVSATPTQYGGLVLSTAAGSTALSTLDGSSLSQSAAINGGDRWLRPVIEQKVDRWGNVVEVNDPRSLSWKTRYKYNASDQLIQETRPDASGATNAASPVTQIYFDRLGRQVAVRDANGDVNGRVFDAAGNLIEERHADGGVVVHSYDAFGNKVRTFDAVGHVVGFSFDHLGHLLSMNRGEAGVWRANASNQLEGLGTRVIVESWTYDQLGRKVSQTNGNGETLRYGYDLRGNLIETRQPLGQSVRAAFDAQGRKLAEIDANGAVATWQYTYFGRLIGHTDLGGASYSYSYNYDNAGQLVSQTSTRGQSLTFGYDAAGQQTSITDWASGKVSTFVYDLAGRRIREKVVQGGLTYQDNHLSYDAQGRLRDVADARVHITMEYDKVGNRTHVTSSVDYQGTAGEVRSSSDRYFRYDAMNRQIVVDAIDAAGNIGHDQGHLISYDKNGNRTSDTSWGHRITTSGGEQVISGYDPETGEARYYNIPVTYTQSDGISTETYRYDALNRLESVVRDGVQIDLRHYDGADRVIQSGPAANLPQGYADAMNAGVVPGQVNGKEMRINRYDANGRLMHQKVLKTDATATKMDISWDAAESATLNSSTFSADGYDAAGNSRGYVVQSWEGTPYINEYVTTLQKADSYQEASTAGTSTMLLPGTTAQQYDANGYLVGVTDSTQSNNNRTFVNDDAGRALWVRQAGNVQRQLIVNGEVLGVYGVGVNPLNPTSGSNNNPNFADLVDFDFGYARISASYPNASPGAYQVRTGDTLQSIAQAAYGDSKLWYRIADSNGLGSSTDLKVGQTLTIPAGVGTISNDATTFKPYDPTRLQGDMTPSLAMPAHDGGCGGMGQLLMVVVAVAVTIYTAGALSGAGETFAQTMSAGVGVMEGSVTAATVSGTSAMATLGTTGTLAVSAAAGAAASQIVGLATGTIDRFSWKGVALSAVSAGVTQGWFPAAAGESTLATVARYAAANAVTQGIGVVTGLQKRFDWRAVAASGVAAGVSAEVGPALRNSMGGTPVGRFLAAAMTGVASGAVAAAMRGGRVSVQQVATDAFGNALGSSLAMGSTSGSSKLSDEDVTWLRKGLGLPESPEPGMLLAQSATGNSKPPVMTDAGPGSSEPDDGNFPNIFADIAKAQGQAHVRRAQSIAVTSGAGGPIDTLGMIDDPYVVSGSEGFEGQIAAPMGQAIADYRIGPRALGATGLLLSGYGVAAGVGTLNPALTAVSVDQMYASAKLMITGEASPTFLNRGLQAGLGLHPSDAALAEIYFTAGVAAGPSLVSTLRTGINGFGNIVSDSISSTLEPYASIRAGAGPRVAQDLNPSAGAFKSFGVDTATAREFLGTPAGRDLLSELSAGDPNASASIIKARAMDLLSTGSNPPRAQVLTSPLVKIVPEGQNVSPYSPFFSTHAELNQAIRSGRTLADWFGLPLKSEAPSYSIYEISPVQPALVFSSKIAPTSELGGLVQRSAQGLQVLVPNRALWSQPRLVGTTGN